MTVVWVQVSLAQLGTLPLPGRKVDLTPSPFRPSLPTIHDAALYSLPPSAVCILKILPHCLPANVADLTLQWMVAHPVDTVSSHWGKWCKQRKKSRQKTERKSSKTGQTMALWKKTTFFHSRAVKRGEIPRRWWSDGNENGDDSVSVSTYLQSECKSKSRQSRPFVTGESKAQK
jgi:hypothetical protein